MQALVRRATVQKEMARGEARGEEKKERRKEERKGGEKEQEGERCSRDGARGRCSKGSLPSRRTIQNYVYRLKKK